MAGRVLLGLGEDGVRSGGASRPPRLPQAGRARPREEMELWGGTGTCPEPWDRLVGWLRSSRVMFPAAFQCSALGRVYGEKRQPRLQLLPCRLVFGLLPLLRPSEAQWSLLVGVWEGGMCPGALWVTETAPCDNSLLLMLGVGFGLVKFHLCYSQCCAGCWKL